MIGMVAMEKKDIFYIMMSYILEIKENLLPQDISPNMDFADIDVDEKDKQQIIDGAKEIFDVIFLKIEENSINTIKDLSDLIYKYQGD